MNEETKEIEVPVVEPTIEPERKKPDLVLTDEQAAAVARIICWFKEPINVANHQSNNEFKLGGYAGTGKTTVIKTIREQLRKDHVSTVCCAFTGKAVNVLQRKGIPAQTMHTLMYDVEVLPDGSVDFNKKSTLLSSPDLIIVDESSMLSSELYNDLISFNIPCLFVGDPGQLEPVGDNPNLMAKPDVVLEKIHRQAETSPIIQLASNIRKGGSVVMPQVPDENKSQLVIRDKQITASLALEEDQIICARNKTRTSINDKVRTYMKYPPSTIVADEKIIVLRNNRNYGVYNGTILFVDAITNETKDYWEVTATDEVGNTFRRLPLWKEPFTNPMFDVLHGKSPKIPFIGHGRDRKAMIYATYGYCITCHKSQGSEWDKVLVFDEWMPPTVWDMKRWRYTAITRAAKQLTYCVDRI